MNVQYYRYQKKSGGLFYVAQSLFYRDTFKALSVLSDLAIDDARSVIQAVDAMRDAGCSVQSIELVIAILLTCRVGTSLCGMPFRLVEVLSCADVNIVYYHDTEIFLPSYMRVGDGMVYQ